MSQIPGAVTPYGYTDTTSSARLGKGSYTSSDLSKQLAQLIQAEISQMKSQGKLPKYDFSNLNSSVIDPTQYATGLADSQFGPQIAALQHQMSQAPAQYKLNQSNITDWFNQAQGTYDKGAAEASSQYDKAAKDLSGSAAGFMAALGGSANSANQGIAQQALIGQNQLAGNHMADINLNQAMAGLIPLSAAQAHVNETGYDRKEMGDWQNQLTAAQSAKGSAYQSAFQDATGKKFDQLSSIDSAKANAAQTIFSDILERKNSNTQSTAALVNSIITAAMAPGQLNAQTLGNNLLGAKIKGVNTQTKLLTGGVNLSNPGQAASFEKILRGAITKTTIDPTTGNSITTLNGNPRKAWSEVQGVLARYGLVGPQGQAFAKSVFKDYLKGNNGGWFFDPSGKLTTRAEAGAKALQPAASAVGALSSGLTTPDNGDRNDPFSGTDPFATKSKATLAKVKSKHPYFYPK